MTVEILPDGGVAISGSPDELRKLSGNISVALQRHICKAAFLTEDGVAEFVITCLVPLPAAMARP